MAKYIFLLWAPLGLLHSFWAMGQAPMQSKQSAAGWALIIDAGKIAATLPGYSITAANGVPGYYFRQEAGILYTPRHRWYATAVVGYASHVNQRNFFDVYYYDDPNTTNLEGALNHSTVHTQGGYFKVGGGYLVPLGNNQKLGVQMRYWHSFWAEQHTFDSEAMQDYLSPTGKHRLMQRESSLQANGMELMVEWYAYYNPGVAAISVSAGFRKVLQRFHNQEQWLQTFTQQQPFGPPTTQTLELNTQTQYIPGFGAADQYFFSSFDYTGANPRTTFHLTFPALQFYVLFFL